MNAGTFQLIFFVLTFAGTGYAVKTCSTWQDYWNFFGANSCRENLDADDEFVGIVGRWGKKVETHEITTYDGYILTLFRIVSNEQNASPVLLLHGIFMNSLALVNRGKKSLAHQFAEKGYDVWLLNWRGTKYSKKHIALKSTDKAYWSFSLHELGIYDLPQALQEIKKANSQKVLTVGFEIGNTAAFIYASTYPDEAKKCLSGMVALSPTGAPINVGFFTKMMFYSVPVLMKPMLLYFYHGEVPAIYQNFRATVFCRKSGIWFARFCDASFMMPTGLDIKQQDPDTIPVIVALNKDSNSLMTFEHFYQMAVNRNFQQFDYGDEKNRAMYGKNKPPSYDLSKINVPQLFFVGRNDKAGTLQDATVMYQHIPSEYQQEFYVIEYEKFGLADFVQAKDINDFLHSHLMSSVTNLVPPVGAN
ncbi:lipase member K-like [Coccinella septempunctata]|uniref:lipase member K-like n=1 Tax=Coccinella septempunctata TaxID=41139 RepID=UPI001D075F69|nr:lipase member K-like [Coccinella septempunctata]